MLISRGFLHRDSRECLPPIQISKLKQAASSSDSVAASTIRGMGKFSEQDEGNHSEGVVRSLGGAVAKGGRRGLAKTAGVGMVTAWRVRIGSRAAIDGTKERAGRVLSAAQALVASDLSGDLNRLVAAAVKGVPTVYDKAMDANYLDPALRTGLGGSYHRLFDGGHSIAGAFRAARGVSADDTVVQEALGTIKALLRDASTPRGLPLATWDKATFDSVAAALESKFGIPKAWFYELNTYDAADLLGGAIGVVSVIYRWNRADTEEFARLASVIGTSAAVSTNPLLLVVSVVAMARAYNKASDADDICRTDRWRGYMGAATSGASLGAIAVAGSLGASAGLALVVIGVTTGVLAYNAVQSLRQSELEWAAVIRPLRQRASSSRDPGQRQRDGPSRLNAYFPAWPASAGHGEVRAICCL